MFNFLSKKMDYDILGTTYHFIFGTRDKIHIADGYDGECHVFSKEILVCTDQGECTYEEMQVKVSEILAHEIMHAFLNEAGIDCEQGEECVCNFYMKNWRKMNNLQMEILDRLSLI